MTDALIAPGTTTGPSSIVAGRSDTVTQALEVEIAQLSDLDMNGLRQRWRKLFRSSAPSHLPRYLLARVVAYRLQANAFGDLDRETARFLDRIARNWKQRQANGGSRSSKKPPPIPPVPDGRSLK